MTKEERLHQMLLASAGLDSLQNEARMYAEKYENPRIAEMLPQFGRVILALARHGIFIKRDYGVEPEKAFREYLEKLQECEEASRE